MAGRGERGNFLYCLRLSLDSVWKVGKKRGWWRGVAGGDVLLFTAALMVTGAVFERRRTAVRGPVVRKGLGWARGEGWRDGGVEEREKEE